MKIALATTAIAAASLFGFTPEAEAGNFGFSISTGGVGVGYRSGYGGHYPAAGYRSYGRSYGYSGGYRSSRSYYSGGGYCNTPRLVRTCEINRCRHRKVRYSSCGRAYPYYVTVVTYRATYSNGTHRTYTKTLY